MLAVPAGIILFLDQWSKAAVRAAIPYGKTWVPWDWLEPYARIVHWSNTGAAFGLFQGRSLIFTLLAIIVAILIVYYYPQIPHQETTLRLVLGVMLGGALGNLTDRLILGQVTDFISVGNFAVFNIADASIFIGVTILLVITWWEERHPAASPNPAGDPPSEQEAIHDV